MGGHGKSKIEVKKIDDVARSQASYTKRRNGVLKKAYEMSVLCGVDVAFVASSSSGRISQFPSNERIAELIERYVNSPYSKKIYSVEDQQYLLKLTDCIKRNEIQDFPSINQQIKDLEQQIVNEKQEIKKIDSKIREFEPNLSKLNRIRGIDQIAKFLEYYLARVKGIKEVLLDDNATGSHEHRDFEGLASNLGNVVINQNYSHLVTTPTVNLPDEFFSKENMQGNEDMTMNHQNQADQEDNFNPDDLLFFNMIDINRN